MMSLDTQLGITLDVQKHDGRIHPAIPAIAYTAYVYEKGILTRTRSAESEELAVYIGRLMAQDIRAAKRFPLRISHGTRKTVTDIHPEDRRTKVWS